MPDSYKTRILVLIDWFTPGYRAGGPIQSVQNFAQSFGDDYDISVITTAYDHGVDAPYPGVALNQWTQTPEGTRVFYFTYDHFSRRSLKALLSAENPDFVYLQSMFSLHFTLRPLLWASGIWPRAEVILAPRGMLHAGAMRFSGLKKRMVLGFLKGLGIQRSIRFQATDEQEVSDIRRYFGSQARVHVASNLPQQHQPAWDPQPKPPGQLKLVFASRVHPKKNLGYLLRLLPYLDGEVQLDIYGPCEDEDHVQALQQLAAGLDASFQVRFMGEMPPHELQPALTQYHFAVLPTLGENFGHSIFEAMLAGLPVIISDRTPWRDLTSRQLGWALPLDARERWIEALQNALDMDEATYRDWSQATWEFARRYKQHPDLLRQIERLFLPEGRGV